MRETLGILIVLAALPCLAAAGEDAKTELAALKGAWKAVAFEANGQPIPKEAVPPFTFVIGEDGKCVGKSPDGDYTCNLTLDPSKSPKTLDNRHDTGPDQGKTQHGVYKLEGEKFTVCITVPGSAATDRPKDFNTAGTAYVLFVFEREK